MKANSRTFAVAMLASAFATTAWAQELGQRALPNLLHAASAGEIRPRSLDGALVRLSRQRQAFTEAAAADPECAIAHWGIAISHRPNPLILPLSAAVLKNGLEAVEKGKAIGAKTERERDWLAAIELYYKDYDKVDQTARGLAYEKAMERLMQKYPDDPEAPSSTHWR